MTYDPAADAMYLYLTERAAEGPEVARTEEVAAGAMLDFDSDGRVIGIEILWSSVARVRGRPSAKAWAGIRPFPPRPW